MLDNFEKANSKQEKAISLFEFIEELNKLKQKIFLKTSDYPWYCFISKIPNDPENISVYYCDRVEEDTSDNDRINILLSVHKPEFQRCPQPDVILIEWLNSGWDNFRIEVTIKNKIQRNPEAQDSAEFFDDNFDRKRKFTEWKQERDIWAAKQKVYAKTRDFFAELYNRCVDLERESETMELIVADGFICDRDNPEINHPILTRRVNIRHDALENTIYIEDADVQSELYTAMFQQDMADINLESIKAISNELKKEDYHPLDRNSLPSFFKTFIHQLSSDSKYSQEGIPENWQEEERLLLYHNPCYIMRKRINGVPGAIKQIIENIQATGYVPNHIGDIVNGGKIDILDDSSEISIEEQLAAVGGESVDILLSKEANKEQLEIARRIERYNAVLVQGPPGTGKTHTIANLLGHFLAQGKSVLVTSHTKKALSVLKEKVPAGLQSLCVSMLEDSNIDMERSIDGITSYMSNTTSFELKKEMDSYGRTRKTIIDELASVRKKLFAIINKECDSIVYNGESISPSKAAAFVNENSENLSYIPGNVRLYEPLPLNFNELIDLYRSNAIISSNDETEFDNEIPDPRELMLPTEFEAALHELNKAETRLKDIAQTKQWDVNILFNEKKISINADFGEIVLNYPNISIVEDLKNIASKVGKVEEWMQYCAVYGRKGGSYRQLWDILIEQIKNTCSLADRLTVKKFGKSVQILNDSPSYINAVKQLQDKYHNKGKIGWSDMLFNKQLKVALAGALINGAQMQTAADCDLVIGIIEMQQTRNTCASYWNDLIGNFGGPKFNELDTDNPEQIAYKYIDLIQKYLDWYMNDFSGLQNKISEIGVPCKVIFQYNALDSEITVTKKILEAVEQRVPLLCEILYIVNFITEIIDRIEHNKNILCAGKRIYSKVCKAAVTAIDAKDSQSYSAVYDELKAVYAKYDLEYKREEYLKRLEPIAPQWADAIRQRIGVHGNHQVPNDIADAWKWKQYCGIIMDLTAQPYEELQKKSIELSKKYRKITAEYAEKAAWYYLLHRTEHDITIKQALEGWKQTVKRIGKGTGKNAPLYRAKARELMAKCQSAVPVWIMPIGKALESLSPKENRFDVVIIDEASQSDISSLAILYMGKKLIIVGDDKQVSPMAVGMEVDRMNSLKNMYLEGKIPNAHLYDAKTSIYDIAATTFQPLMLREHFRCMPEIIGFSNWLSYDFKIKPLRDSSNSILLPSVINYRVANGERVGKTNPNEAKTIVALMKACIEQPEYSGKTFGIISLLGDEQVNILQKEVYRQIDTKELTKRKILCGNASNFQGDERDVIFLSVVDSGNNNGPLKLTGYGQDDAYRKRYNVAASRARDQLWVVDSLDPANDLKDDDIRKMLIEYSQHPESVEYLNKQIQQKSDSPFEVAVASSLVAQGYHIVQQWSVGAYRIDMVAVYRDKKVAIECDGERYHSGEEKIREDMERQTILERLGWRFIRIRGSEYYRDPEKTMQRVIAQLHDMGIEKEDVLIQEEFVDRGSELLERVKKRAHEFIKQMDLKNDTIDIAAVAYPLSNAENENRSTKNSSKIINNNSDATHSKVNISKTSIGYSFAQSNTSTNVFSALKTGSGNFVETAKVYEQILNNVPKTKINIATQNKPHKQSAQSQTIQVSGSKNNNNTNKNHLQNLSDKKKKDITSLLKAAGISYVDNRDKGGALWITGGMELKDTGIIDEAKNKGYIFYFKASGSKATNNQPGWWTK